MKSLSRIFFLFSATLIVSQMAVAEQRYEDRYMQTKRYNAYEQRMRPTYRGYHQDSRSVVRNRTALPGRTYVPGGYRSSNGVFHSEN